VGIRYSHVCLSKNLSRVDSIAAKDSGRQGTTGSFLHKPLAFFLIFAIPEKSGFGGITLSITHKILPAS